MLIDITYFQYEGIECYPLVFSLIFGVAMKFSRYCKMVELNENEENYLFFSGLSGSLIKINASIFNQIHQCMQSKAALADLLASEKNADLIKNLKIGAYLIPGDLDEIKFLKTRYNISRLNDMPHLSLLPTLDCNLACRYCYEKRSVQYMNEQTIKHVKKFFDSWISAHGGKQIQIDWFGGEPLLAIDTIADLSSHFKKAAKNVNASYASAVVTNGTLMTKETCDKLIEADVTRCQITLDGPQEVHDQRRPYRNRTGSSFDMILQNLQSIIDRMTVYVRINVDPSNAEKSFQLMEMFHERGWLDADKNFHPYIAAVSPLSEKCYHVKDCCFSSTDFMALSKFFFTYLEKYRKIKRNPFYLYPANKKFNCGAISLNSLVIGPNGLLYKCGLTVDDPQNAVGSIWDAGFSIQNQKMLNWLDFNPFDKQKCVQCDLLPMCLGGCPKTILYQDLDMAENNCEFIRKNFEEMIRFHGS